MSSNKDDSWHGVVPAYRWTKAFLPLTSQEADAAFEEAAAISLSQDEVDWIVASVIFKARVHSSPSISEGDGTTANFS
jgi:hypothetical protein